MTQVSCQGGNDGTATAQIIPAAAGATYAWSNGQTTPTIAGLSAGTYTCNITTPSGCSGSVSITVTEVPAMILSLTNLTNASCNSINNGGASINVTQGTPGYLYSWTGSASTSNVVNDLGAGSHTVTVTDAMGCVQDTTFSITEPPALVISFLTQDTMICPEASITLTAKVSEDRAHTFSIGLIITEILSGLQAQSPLIQPELLQSIVLRFLSNVDRQLRKIV